MRKLIHIHFLIAVVGLLLQCKQPVAEQTKKNHSYQIQPDGLSWVKVGQYIKDVDTQQVAYSQYNSEQQYENDFTWIMLTITLVDGSQVLVEGEFFEQDKVRPEQIIASRVNRVRIETPQYTTPEGLSVGSTFNELQSLFPDSVMNYRPFIEQNQIEVYIPRYSPYHYLFPIEKKDTTSVPKDWKIDPETRIAAIVIM